MNNFFDARSEEKCLEDLAADLVWITPKQMYHFLTDEEVRDFLHGAITEKMPERRFVDIVSIKSSPSVTDISTVAYELNLVPRDHDKAVHLRCSMAVVKRGQRYEITFIHMSEKQGGGGKDQIREFSENLPCGVLIFAYMKEMGLHTVFYNDYFAKKLHYKEEQFQKQMERDPFFMIAEEEREQLMDRISETAGKEPVTVNVTFFRKDGNRFQYRMIAAPAYQEGENTVFYSVFQETTGFNRLHAQIREQMSTASDILGNVPGGLCVLTGDTGDWKPVYVTRKLTDRFGLSMAAFAKEVALNPFYGLEMTSITRKRLTETHLEMLSSNPYVGMFPMLFADGSKRWTDVYLVNAADHNGNRLRMLYYVDKDEERKATDRQIAKAENASRLQQERARMEIREAEERARQQVEEAQTTVRKEIEEAQAKTQEQIESFRARMNQILDSQKGTVKEQERVLQATFDAREKELAKSYEEKEKGLEERLENYRKVQEAELARRQKVMDSLTAEYDRALAERQTQIEKLEQENERIMHDLRESETLRESQLSASKVRERDSDLRERELKRRDGENQRKIQELTATIEQLQAEMSAVTAAGTGLAVSAGDGSAISGIDSSAISDRESSAIQRGQEQETGKSKSGKANRVSGEGRQNRREEESGRKQPEAAAVQKAGGSEKRPDMSGGHKAGGSGKRPDMSGVQKTGSSGSGWLFDNIMHPAQKQSPKDRAVAARSAADTGTDEKTPEESGKTAWKPAGERSDSMHPVNGRPGDMKELQLPETGGDKAHLPINDRKETQMPQDSREDMQPQDLLIQEEEEGDVLFDIEECMLDVLRLMEPACKRKRIDMELRSSTSMPPKAIGDKAGLRRALISLLESATNQTPEGGKISLGCRADMASGNRAYLYFNIRDNGSGIASELMTGMFDRKDEKEDPLRAGLYNAREIISGMGGNVRVRSRRGEGTEFTVTVCMYLPPRNQQA
ncbi:MAG: ATP-binding protein [Eubacteriales bacterium]|nr:ATP-binding protein [Eubacteriales bacterium]